jgi:hypothetical protein
VLLAPDEGLTKPTLKEADMAKSNSTRARAPDFYTRKPTTAERNRAIKHLQKQGGAHVAKPVNLLVGATPADTLESCRRVIDWVAGASESTSSADCDAARTDVLFSVVDALRHAETVLRDIGSLPDAPKGDAP